MQFIKHHIFKAHVRALLHIIILIIIFAYIKIITHMIGTNKKFTALNLPVETVANIKKAQMLISLKKSDRVTYEDIINEAIKLYAKKHKLEL